MVACDSVGSVACVRDFRPSKFVRLRQNRHKRATTERSLPAKCDIKGDDKLCRFDAGLSSNASNPTLEPQRHAYRNESKAYCQSRKTSWRRYGESGRHIDEYEYEQGDYDVHDEYFNSDWYSSRGRFRDRTDASLLCNPYVTPIPMHWSIVQECMYGRLSFQSVMQRKWNEYSLPSQNGSCSVDEHMHAPVQSLIEVDVCQLSGKVLCSFESNRTAHLAYIKRVIACMAAIPPSLQYLHFEGQECVDDHSQPFLVSTADCATVTCIIKREGLSEDEALRVCKEFVSMGPMVLRSNLECVVQLSASHAVYAWYALDSLNTSIAREKRQSYSCIIAGLLVGNGNELSAQRETQGLWNSYYRRRWNGHGTYRTWVCSSQRSCEVRRSIWCFSRFGYSGIAAVMNALRGPLSHAGPHQKALLLLCSAQPLLYLSKREAVTCADFYVELLNEEHSIIRVCAILCLQRIMSTRPLAQGLHIGGCLGDDCPNVKRVALVALGALGRPRAEMFKEDVLALLADDDIQNSAVRRAAFKALRTLAPTADPRVAKHLQDRYHASAAFQVLVRSKAIAQPWEPEFARYLGNLKRRVSLTTIAQGLLHHEHQRFHDRAKRMLISKIRTLSHDIKKFSSRLKASDTPVSSRKSKKLKAMKRKREHWRAVVNDDVEQTNVFCERLGVTKDRCDDHV
eukprot:TRINITY_DN6637_c0_g1_i1.p1 TRINITY_DN6637_c0_g1~~TRINITY_DN6637_c0_g1_i1.p1  ORF type:complete len:681 (-),score=44.04 TRINITY_DN6637_c0_g1_i1:393-2435(-)